MLPIRTVQLGGGGQFRPVGKYSLVPGAPYWTNQSRKIFSGHNQHGQKLLQYQPEIHTKRQATQHDWPPSLLGDRNKGIETSYGEEKIFWTGLTRAAKAEQKSLVPAWQQAQLTNQGRSPFMCTLWVDIHLSFNSQQGPSLSIVSLHGIDTPMTPSHCQSHFTLVNTDDTWQRIWWDTFFIANQLAIYF
jgi:hypothetical protein